MNRSKKAVRLSLAVYRVTDLFPQGEALTYQIRELTNQIVADLTAKQTQKAAVKMKVLLQYFQVAKVQNWTKKLNFDILSKEYASLLSELAPKRSRKKRKMQLEVSSALNDRQASILAYGQKSPAFGIRDLVAAFPQCSRRTLNRDLDFLCSLNCLARNGRGRTVTYTRH